MLQRELEAHVHVHMCVCVRAYVYVCVNQSRAAVLGGLRRLLAYSGAGRRFTAAASAWRPKAPHDVLDVGLRGRRGCGVFDLEGCPAEPTPARWPAGCHLEIAKSQVVCGHRNF